MKKELKQKIKTFFSVTEKHFSFLKDYDYYVKKKGVATQYSVSDIFEFIYENEKLDRSIVITYEPNDIDNVVVDLISISIFKGIKLLIKKIEFDLFLEKYKPEINTDGLNYPNKNNKSSFKENMEISINGFAYFLKDIGINLVNGTEWEDGLIYDWSSAEEIIYKAQKDMIYRKGDKEDTGNGGNVPN